MSLHAIQRAKERYRIDLTMEDIELIASIIRDRHPCAVQIGCGTRDLNGRFPIYAVRVYPEVSPPMWMLAICDPYHDCKVVIFYGQEYLRDGAWAMLKKRERKLVGMGLEPNHSYQGVIDANR